MAGTVRLNDRPTVLSAVTKTHTLTTQIELSETHMQIHPQMFVLTPPTIHLASVATLKK